MTLRAEFAGAPVSLGGAGAMLEVRHTQHALGTNVQPGSGGFTDGGFVRYAGALVSIPGMNGWGAGSGGQTPQRGYVVANNAGCKFARNTAAGNTPYDWYCGVCAVPVLEPPVVNLNSSLSVFEVGVQMRLSAVPAAPITRDCGLVMMMASATSFANCMRAGVAAGNDYAGFGVVFNNLGDLIWIAKKNGAGGGSALSEQVTLVTGTSQRLTPVRIRVHSASLGVEAKVEVFVDNVPVLSRNWGAGTVLPVAADATFSAQMGYFRPLLRAAQEVAANVSLQWRDEYLRAAATASLLD